MLTWVVGAGGLLGAAVARAGAPIFSSSSPVPWPDPNEAAQVLASDLTRFVREAGEREWALVWAAGSGVVASSRSALERETEVLERFVARVRSEHPRGPGTFFLASSAGGVYAGSARPPFSEATTPRPINPYGKSKLAQEQLARSALDQRVPLVIGRFSNLYGPGQNLAKPQGLVSHLCLGAATRRAVNVFVPMQTLRDYLFADDAARMVLAAVDRSIRAQSATALLRNLASEQPTTVAYLVRLVQQVARHPVRIVLGAATNRESHVLDLRVVSREHDEVDAPAITPLPVGVKRIYDHILETVRRASLRAA